MELNREQQKGVKDMTKRSKMAEGVIDTFKGQHAFLSNFYPCTIDDGFIVFQNAEAAYQAQKDPKRSHEFADLPPNKAKRLGRQVQLANDWEHIKDKHMLAIVRYKFLQHPDLADKLIATGNKELIEGNWWGDTYWGVCKGKGQNKLGKMLMSTRQEIYKYREMGSL